MNRPLLLVASPHSSIVAALRQQLEIFLPHDAAPHRVVEARFACFADLFEQLDRIDSDCLRDTMVLLDVGGESDAIWDVREMDDVRGVIPQLVLSFPEVYFVFCPAAGPVPPLFPAADDAAADRWADKKLRTMIEAYHSPPDRAFATIFRLIRLHANGFRTIFDATGLRSVFKRRLLEEVGHPSANIYAPLCSSRIDHAACVSDEEIAFVSLNGYAVYKAGFRVWTLTTEAEFTRLLIAPPCTMIPARVALAVTDWDLAYPDHRQGEHGEEPEPSLVTRIDFSRVSHLICITSYQDDVQRALLEQHNGFRTAKPYGGFFDLLSRRPSSGINPIQVRFRAAWGVLSSSGYSATSRNTRIVAGVAAGRGSHSAPHARAGIANRLLNRVRRFPEIRTAGTVTSVHKALLAAEAKEVLGGLSRTTAYEALAVQAEAEVISELSFFGISSQFLGVADRLQLLEREARMVQVVGHSASQPGELEGKEGWSNFMQQVSNQLRLGYAEFEQVEAAELCLRYFAGIQSRLAYARIFSPSATHPECTTSTVPPSPASTAVSGFVRWCGGAYLDWATDSGTSISKLFKVSVAWVIVFAIAYCLLFSCAPVPADSVGRRVELACWHSAFTFIELQPGLAEADDLKKSDTLPRVNEFGSPGWRWLQVYRLILLVEIGVAYLHLGLLVSVLYRRITKRAP